MRNTHTDEVTQYGSSTTNLTAIQEPYRLVLDQTPPRLPIADYGSKKNVKKPFQNGVNQKQKEDLLKATGQ